MSSLRNAVQRRNHRERAQPLERAKWGILEKHKDYKLRAADHNVKKRKIKALKEKVATRNEDEFYFAMMNSSTQGGIKRAKRGEENSGGGGKSLDLDVVKLLKTQDQGYLQTMLQRARKERERMEQAVAVHANGVNVTPSERRVVFNELGEIDDAVSSSEELDFNENYDEDLSGFGLLDTPFEGDEVVASEEEEEDDDDDDDDDDDKAVNARLTPEQRKARQLRKRALTVKRRKLSILKEQEEKLRQALSRLDHQRAKMNGTIGGINKKGVSFRSRHRKR